MFVRQLTFEPEHAEIVATPGIDVVTDLVPVADSDAATVEIIFEIAAVIAVSGVDVGAVVAPHGARVDAYVAAMVAGCRRRSDRSRGGGCQKIFPHWHSPVCSVG